MNLILALFAALIGLSAGVASGTSSAGGGTEVTANIKLVVNAIESCAASRVDGTYSGRIDSQPDVEDCLDPATLQEFEGALGDLDLGTSTPEPGGVQVAHVGADGMGYLVQAATDDGYFVEIHEPDGRLFKFCGTEPFTPASTTPGDGDVDGCHDGDWGTPVDGGLSM
jgi:hypothetical protein